MAHVFDTLLESADENQLVIVKKKVTDLLVTTIHM